MCVYIGIEDLVANALIEMVERDAGRKVLFKDLEAYGAEVISFLSSHKEQAVLVLSKERTSIFLHDYSQFFKLYTNENGIDEGIELKSEVTIEALWDTFRGYLSADVLMAFMADSSVKELGVNVA